MLALPGGAIGRTLGDKRTTIAALLLMTAGSLVMATTDIWGWQMAGRLVSGAGGVLLTVQLTKMGTDWFAGKEIATAMAIFVNSWPAGVAISLLVLPAIGTAYGASAVFLAAGALTAIGIVLITLYPVLFARGRLRGWRAWCKALMRRRIRLRSHPITFNRERHARHDR
ncbi:MFS family permease [Bradyrhizobium barranii subsp. barranii]